MAIDTWNNRIQYNPGAVVTHQGKTYVKANDQDQSAPDDIAGGWDTVNQNTSNLNEYLPIQASLSSFEERVRQHQSHLVNVKKSAEAKLKALGLTEEEIGVLVQ